MRLNVQLASEGRQIPWESTSLEEDLYLFPDQRKKLSEAEQDQFYPAEFYVGKRWHTIFRQRRPSGQTYTYRYDVRVVGRASITVPAGMFDAFKIEARGFNMQQGAILARYIWVAPGVPADIVHETIVRQRSGAIEQFDRQELASLAPPP